MLFEKLFEKKSVSLVCFLWSCQTVGIGFEPIAIAQPTAECKVRKLNGFDWDRD